MRSAFGDHVEVAMDGYIAAVTFNRPPHNFVSVGFMRDLSDAMDSVDAENKARAVVLQSEGKTFSAGADFSPSTQERTLGTDELRAFYDQAVRLFSVKLPIVAAIQGAAVGAGLGLALVSDFRVATPDARFVANFTKLNFHPGFGLTHTLPRLIGQQKASLMFLTGRRIKAEEGLAWGLVDEVVPAHELRPAARRLAAEIAANGPLAVAATRNTFRGKLYAEVCAQLDDIEYPEQVRLRETEDFQEGVRSVAERRPGNFVGR